PAAFTHGRRRHQTQPLASVGVDLEDRHLPPGLNAFEMKARNDPVVGEAEGEVRVFVEWQHVTPFPPKPARRRLRQPRHESGWGYSKPGNLRRTPARTLPRGRWATRSPPRKIRTHSWPRPSSANPQRRFLLAPFRTSLCRKHPTK